MQNSIASENTLKLTPNFKASFGSSQMEKSLDYTDSEASWDPPQKSIDLVPNMSNNALANTLSRRSASSNLFIKTPLYFFSKTNKIE